LSDPSVTAKWRQSIPDDVKGKLSNAKGTLCYAATSQKNSRTTQVRIVLCCLALCRFVLVDGLNDWLID
jgi:hypothetical protein